MSKFKTVSNVCCGITICIICSTVAVGVVTAAQKRKVQPCDYTSNVVMCVVAVQGNAHYEPASGEAKTIKSFTRNETKKRFPVLSGDSFWLEPSASAEVVRVDREKDTSSKGAGASASKGCSELVGRAFESKLVWSRANREDLSAEDISRYRVLTRVGGISGKGELNTEAFGLVNVASGSVDEGSKPVMIFRGLLSMDRLEVLADGAQVLLLGRSAIQKRAGGYDVAAMVIKDLHVGEKAMTLIISCSGRDRYETRFFKFRCVRQESKWDSLDALFVDRKDSIERWELMGEWMVKNVVDKCSSDALSEVISRIRTKYKTYAALQQDASALALLEDVAEAEGISAEEAKSLFLQGAPIEVQAFTRLPD